MPRKGTYLKKPHNQIAKCIKDQSINGLLWAFIQLAQDEIKQDGKSITFSGSDLSKFVALLHQREVTDKLNPPDKQLDDTAISAWLLQSQQNDTSAANDTKAAK
jgi:hypothetical protein